MKQLCLVTKNPLDRYNCLRKLTFDEQIHGFVFCTVGMEPRENGIGVDAVVQVLHQLPEDHPLLARSMGGDPEPTVAHVVVDEEDVAFFEC
mgnify:CR=1 FL=1